MPGTLKIINDWGITNLEGGGTYGLPMEEFQGLLKKNNLEEFKVDEEFIKKDSQTCQYKFDKYNKFIINE